MAGVDVGGGGGGKRKSMDSEVNMIPFIDLLFVTIAFLLITAVWSQMARINADAQVPGPPRPEVEQEKVEPEKQLHIEMRAADKFTLIWKQGGTTVNSIDLPRPPDSTALHLEGKTEIVRYPELGDKVQTEWKANGSHQAASDHKLDQCILHTDNKTEYKYIIAVIDAVYQAKRDMNLGTKTAPVSAFNVTFAVN
jgi:biopolymer transport protein ExbD